MATKPRRPPKRKGPRAQELDAWDKQPGESDRAYGNFLAYRDMDAPRAIRRLGLQLGKTRQALEETSKRWSWRTRVTAWDNEQGRIQAAGLAKERDRAGREQARVARFHMEALLQPAVEIARRMAEAQKAGRRLLGDMPLGELYALDLQAARAAQRVQVVERLALGMSTENVDVIDERAKARAEAERKSDDELRGYLAGDEDGSAPALQVLEGGKAS